MNALCGLLFGLNGDFCFRGGIYQTQDTSHMNQGGGKITIKQVHYKVKAITTAITKMAANESASPFLVIETEAVTPTASGAWLVLVAQAFRRHTQRG